MVEENTSSVGSLDLPEGMGPSGADPKVQGWYPSRTNPNDQVYWDGQAWVGRRRWMAGQGWIETGDVPDAPAQSSPERRLTATPYATVNYGKPNVSGATLSLGILIQLACGVALMFGSVGSWVALSGNASVASIHVSIIGTDPAISTLIGVSGWITFIGGILIVIFACFQMTTEEVLVSGLAAVICFATMVFAIYDMFRIVQKINQVTTGAGANVSIGWGLICVLAAAVAATLIAIVRLAQR